VTHDELSVLGSDAVHIMTHQHTGQSHFSGSYDGVGVIRFKAQSPQETIAHLPTMLR
jgi:hypothetical protein